VLLPRQKKRLTTNCTEATHAAGERANTTLSHAHAHTPRISARTVAQGLTGTADSNNQHSTHITERPVARRTRIAGRATRDINLGAALRAARRGACNPERSRACATAGADQRHSRNSRPSARTRAPAPPRGFAASTRAIQRWPTSKAPDGARPHQQMTQLHFGALSSVPLGALSGFAV